MGTLNSLGAILALDTTDLAGEIFKSYRSTNDPYSQKRLGLLKSGEVRVFSEKVLAAAKPWHELTEEERLGIVYKDVPSRDGLDSLNMSGVSQFGGLGFAKIVKLIRDSGHTGGITVFDFREEPHAFINDGIAISLYSRGDSFSEGKDWAEVEKSEGELIKMVANSPEVWINQIIQKSQGLVKETTILVQKVQKAYNEKDLVRQHGCGYARIAVTDHHREMDDDLDDFKQYTDALAPGTWIIAHCRGGKGRTTSAMILKDIVENANKDLSFTDIAIRQWLIGGSNLVAVPQVTPEMKWKAQAAYERSLTLYKFWKDTRAQPKNIRWFYKEDPKSFQGSHFIPKNQPSHPEKFDSSESDTDSQSDFKSNAVSTTPIKQNST